MEKDRTLTPWLDTDLADIEGEEWRDITGYDGLYQVSSYGRIKSLTRYNRLGRIVRERIRRLNFNPKGFATVSLLLDGVAYCYSVMLLVGDAFLTKQNPNQVYIHQNKNLLDNRIANIEVGSRSQSHLLDLKLGKKADRTATLVSFQKQRAAQHIEQFGVVEGNQLVAKTCPACLLVQPLTAYYKNHNSCKACYLKRKALGKRHACKACL
ncbi:MAG: NUMOD4 domain-containing protein [Janthinobacterium lividum]